MLRLRQIALVAAELEPTVESVCETLGVDVGFQDPGVATFGLENAVFPVGNTFLEVVSPARAGTTAGRYLERRKGDGGYMVILQTDDLAGDRARIDEQGVRVVWEAALDDARAIHLHPRDVGGAILSFDEMTDWDDWKWAGPTWREHVRTERATGIVAAELQSDDPEQLAARWSQLLARPCRGNEISLDGGTLRFVRARDGRGEGLGGIDVAVAQPEQAGREITLAGTRVRLVSPD